VKKAGRRVDFWTADRGGITGANVQISLTAGGNKVIFGSVRCGFNLIFGSVEGLCNNEITIQHL